MDPTLHKAAMEGRVDDLRAAMNGNTEHDRTLNGNTVLHVATQFLHSECVEVILEKCPDLLHQVNSKGETALHIAARGGYRGEDIVQALIVCAKKVDPESAGLHQMLRAVNEEGDTALHLAVRINYGFRAVLLLTEGDHEFQHPPNNAQETPLYLACETGTRIAEFLILENCSSPAYSGPGGKTALHAAVVSNASGQMITDLLVKWPDLVRESDEHGWTPLHYAARANNIKAISEILEHDRTVAYIRANNDDHNTALHIAAAQGFIEVIKKILFYCSDCWEIVNGKGQNIFHVAVEMEKNTLLKFLKNKIWSKCLLNQKDIEGNTPLHLLASSTQKAQFFLESLLQEGDWTVLNHKNLTPSDILSRNVKLRHAQVQWQSERKKYEILKAFVGRHGSSDPKVQKQNEMKKDETIKAVVGRRGSTAISDPKDRPIDIPGWRNVVNDDRERMQKLKENEKMNEEARNPAPVERFRKMADAHLIVATLIATVTFAAAFTLPGGYYDSTVDKDQGTAILLKKVAFKVFIISNTIAVASSTASVILHVAASLYDDVDDFLSRCRKAFYLILIAIGAMVLAFVTGVYVVLTPSLSLAIASCVIGSLSFIIFYRELIKMDFFSNLWFLTLELLWRIYWRLLIFFREFWEGLILFGNGSLKVQYYYFVKEDRS